jgi:hypothetical protein
VIRNQAAREPHHLDITARLTLEPAARLDPIEIAVDVKLQQHRRMIGRTAGRLGIDPIEPKTAQIECVDKGINHADGIVLDHPVF